MLCSGTGRPPLSYLPERAGGGAELLLPVKKLAGEVVETPVKDPHSEASPEVRYCFKA